MLEVDMGIKEARPDEVRCLRDALGRAFLLLLKWASTEIDKGANDDHSSYFACRHGHKFVIALSPLVHDPSLP